MAAIKDSGSSFPFAAVIRILVALSQLNVVDKMTNGGAERGGAGLLLAPREFHPRDKHRKREREKVTRPGDL